MHIIVKLLKINDKEKINKMRREIEDVTNGEIYYINGLKDSVLLRQQLLT